MVRVLRVLGYMLWVAAVGAGFGWLAVYESMPGSRAEPPPTWPARSGLVRDQGRWTLVLFLHPHCPCSQATLEEFAALHSRYATHLRAHLVFCKPKGVPPDWEKTATWRRAATVGGVHVHCDERDEERHRFGALTSGHVFLYDPHGRLRYDGGITPARGKGGPSAGRSAVESFLRGEPGLDRTGPVFGCPLVDPEQLGREDGCEGPRQP